MQVRIKMRCVAVTRLIGGSVQYSFAAVPADEVPATERYHEEEPEGEFELVVDNPNVSWQLNELYYFDSNPATTGFDDN